MRAIILLLLSTALLPAEPKTEASISAPVFATLANKNDWPQSITLNKTLELPITLDGETVGSETVEKNKSFKVLSISPKDATITLERNNGTLVTLIDNTDFISLTQKAALARTQKEKKSHELNQLIEKTLADAAAMKKADGYVQPQAVVSRARSSSEKAGFDDGWIFGKADAWAGKKRDGLKAARFGKIHAQDYPGDKKAYAEGYHSGYNEGWHAARSVGAGK